jgi:hypothetical protein
MMQKFLLTASLAGLLLTAGSVWARATPRQSSGEPTQQAPAATKMISGKVTSIGNGGQTFALEVSSGGAAQTMQFTVDKSAKVQGRVTVGTPVTVEYEAMAEGQFRALSITAQG